MSFFLVLPSFINVIYNKRAQDKENKEGNKHVIYCSDVVHLKQLTVNTVQRKLIIFNFKTPYIKALRQFSRRLTHPPTVIMSKHLQQESQIIKPEAWSVMT